MGDYKTEANELMETLDKFKTQLDKEITDLFNSKQEDYKKMYDETQNLLTKPDFMKECYNEHANIIGLISTIRWKLSVIDDLPKMR